MGSIETHFFFENFCKREAQNKYKREEIKNASAKPEGAKRLRMRVQSMKPEGVKRPRMLVRSTKPDGAKRLRMRARSAKPKGAKWPSSPTGLA